MKLYKMTFNFVGNNQGRSNNMSEYYLDSVDTALAWIKSRLDLGEQNMKDLERFWYNGDTYVIEHSEGTTYYSLEEIFPYTMSEL